MSKTLYYGYNESTKSYIKSFGNQVMTTTNFAEATKHKMAYVEACFKNMEDREQWAIIAEGKARNIALRNQRVNARPKKQPQKANKNPIDIKGKLNKKSSVIKADDVKTNIDNAIKEGDVQYLSNVEIAFSRDMIRILKSLIGEKYVLLSQKDRELSDIYHFILINKPPAHIRTKVYGIQQAKLEERANIKDEIAMLKHFRDMVEKQSFDLQALQTKEKIYTPRTPVYAELLGLR